MSTIAQRVAAGVAFLDAGGNPDWWRADIDLGVLDLADCGRCIFGQLYGHYWKGIELHELTDGATVALGFTVTGDEPGQEADESEYAPLTAEWKRVIAGRRAAVYA